MKGGRGGKEGDGGREGDIEVFSFSPNTKLSVLSVAMRQSHVVDSSLFQHLSSAMQLCSEGLH